MKKGSATRRSRRSGGNGKGLLKVGAAFLGAQLARRPEPYFGRGRINQTKVNFKLGKNRSYEAQHPKKAGIAPISRGHGVYQLGDVAAHDSSRFLGRGSLNAS